MLHLSLIYFIFKNFRRPIEALDCCSTFIYKYLFVNSSRLFSFEYLLTFSSSLLLSHPFSLYFFSLCPTMLVCLYLSVPLCFSILRYGSIFLPPSPSLSPYLFSLYFSFFLVRSIFLFVSLSPSLPFSPSKTWSLIFKFHFSLKINVKSFNLNLFF